MDHGLNRCAYRFLDRVEGSGSGGGDRKTQKTGSGKTPARITHQFSNKTTFAKIHESTPGQIHARGPTLSLAQPSFAYRGERSVQHYYYSVHDYRHYSLVTTLYY